MNTTAEELGRFIDIPGGNPRDRGIARDHHQALPRPALTGEEILAAGFCTPPSRDARGQFGQIPGTPLCCPGTDPHRHSHHRRYRGQRGNTAGRYLHPSQVRHRCGHQRGKYPVFPPSVLYDTHPDLTEKQRLDFYRITLDSFVRGHFGQAQDIYWTKNLTEKNLAAWITGPAGRKDPADVRVQDRYCGNCHGRSRLHPCRIGTAESGMPVSLYARALGTAFQIADDIQSFDPVSGDRKHTLR